MYVCLCTYGLFTDLVLIMSKQQIPTVCIQCQKHFLSKKRNTKFCSDICKAQEKRDRDKKLHQSQEKIIKVQSEVIEAVLPRPVDVKPVLNNANQRGNNIITPSMIEYQNNRAIEALLDSHPTKEEIIKNRALAKERIRSFLLNESQVNQIVYDLQLMGNEARDLAVKAGKDKGQWPKYLKEPDRYYELSTTMIKLLR